MTRMKDVLQQLTNDCEQFNASYAVSTLFKATRKTVNIEIAQKDREMLHEAGYNLCFAKKVNDKYTVIWKSYDGQEYGELNTFMWEPRYEVFWTNIFEENVTVQVKSKLLPIGLGETTVISGSGIFQPAVTGGDISSINIKNDKGYLHLGVNQVSTDSSGSLVSTPIYVAPVAMVSTGDAKLTPIETVKVWFQQSIETSTMISDISSEAYEIDLTSQNEYSIKYEDSKWLHV